MYNSSKEDDECIEHLKTELFEDIWSIVQKYIDRGLESSEAWTTVEEVAANNNK